MVNYRIKCKKCNLDIIAYDRTEQEVEEQIENFGDKHQDNEGMDCNGKLYYEEIKLETKIKNPGELDDETKYKEVFDNIKDKTFLYRNIPYFHFDVVDSVAGDKHTEIRELDEGFLSRLAWLNSKLGSNDFDDSLKFVKQNILHEAKFGKRKKELYERISSIKDKNSIFPNKIYYDLCDDSWKAIEISKKGWNIVNPPVLFNRHVTQKPQVVPLKETGVKGIFELSKVIRLPNEDDKNLWLIDLCSCFIPDIEHPIIGTFGDHDSAKSTLDRVRLNIVDPTHELVSFNKNQKDNIINAQSHYMVSYDNISKLSIDESDFLCKLGTGAGFEFRKLWTDRDSSVFSYTRCVSFNGVHNPVIQSDLASRMLIFNLDRVNDENRLDKTEIILALNSMMPSILGSIFDTLVGAMNIVETIEFKKKPRFGDFCRWCSAIAEVIGIGKEKFMELYYNKIEVAEAETAEGDIVITCMKRLLQGGNEGFFKSTSPIQKWEGKSEDLYYRLRGLFISHVPPDFPNTVNSMGKRISYAKKALSVDGIEIYKHATKDNHRKSINKYIITNKNYQEPPKTEGKNLPNHESLNNKTTQEMTNTQHQTGFMGDGTTVERSDKISSKLISDEEELEKIFRMNKKMEE